MRRVEKSKEEEAEVDELLRATEDHLLLNLHVDAHTTAASFDSDLARRFQALKSPAPASSSADPRFPSSKPEDRRGGADADEESKRILGGNLAARFAALKGPISPAESGTGLQQSLPIPNNQDEDEVEKVMQWAMDAARLNPSKPHDNNDDDEEDHSDEDDDEEVKEEKMRESSSSSSSSKGKGKPRRFDGMCGQLGGFNLFDGMLGQVEGCNLHWIRWMEGCMTSTMLSIIVNGNANGFFKATNGVCQEDPISPYLFTLAIEVFSELLEDGLRKREWSSFHDRGWWSQRMFSKGAST